jgi:serine/threonine protein phosphatase PrpC
MNNSPHNPAHKVEHDQTLRFPAAPSLSFAVGTALELGTRESQQDRLFVANFPAMGVAAASEFLGHVIERIDSLTKNLNDGSTFTGAIIIPGGGIVTAHLGDSPASVICLDRNNSLRFIQQLTFPHYPEKVTTPQTALDGTRYQDTRHYRHLLRHDGSRGKGIMLCRALGDREFGGAISHEPELGNHHFESSFTSEQRIFLLVTSDGAHNPKGVDHTKHAFYISRELQSGSTLSDIANGIACNSLTNKDNVAVVLVEIKQGTSGIVAVLDGHGTTADVSEVGIRILSDCVATLVKSGKGSHDLPAS